MDRLGGGGTERLDRPFLSHHLTEEIHPAGDRRRRSRSLSGRLAHPFVHKGQDTGAQRGAIGGAVDDDPVRRIGRGQGQEPLAHQLGEGGTESFQPVGGAPGQTALGHVHRHVDKDGEVGPNPAVAQSTSRVNSAVSSPRP